MPSSPELAVLEEPGLEPVPISELREAWLSVQAPLGKMLKERGEYMLSDILRALCEHEMQLWTDGEGNFMVTQVGSFPTLKVLTVLFAGGSLEAIRAHLGDAEAWARSRGCDEIRVHGREGWERVFHMERLGVTLRRRL